MSGPACLRWLTTALLVVVSALYAAFPTKNYYWDGVSFALAIENADRLSPSLLHPNHLIYNVIGFFLLSGVRAVGANLRGIVVLQGLSILAAIACVWVLHRLLIKITNSAYLATSLSALFAFSSTWWRFATDANAYILGTLALTVAAHFIHVSERPRPILIGFVHACGMLIHQLAAIFFVPVALHIHREYGFRSLFRYGATAGGITFSAYYVAFYLSQHNVHPRAFVQWLTSHSTDVSFSFDLPTDASASAISYVRLFVGGRTSLLREFLGPFAIAVVACLIAVVGMLLLQFWGRWKDLRLLDTGGALGSGARFPIMWMSAYALYLFFWLPHNTFYKLFFLPAIILIAAQILAKYRGPRRYRLALFATAVALANLAFSVFPYSHVKANQPLSFALDLHGRWSERTVVYYASFNTDNWLIRYFNPETTWKQMKSRDIVEMERESSEDIRDGREVWLDTTAADMLAQDTSHSPLDLGAERRELVNSRHRIRFLLLPGLRS